jgi:hypothetical protein
LVVLFVLTACKAMEPERGQAARERHDFGLPPVRAALEFPAGEREVTLGWLVGELARLSGQELTMTPTLRQQLDVSREPLELTTPVPAGEVYAYVEGMLATHGFLIAPVKSGERPVLGVYGSSARRGPVEGDVRAVPIEPGEVEALAAHPALLCQVMLVFENLDSRQLQTQLRQLLVDMSGTQQVVPAGDRGLLVQAPGARLAGLVRLLREVDRASAERPRPVPTRTDSIPEAPSAPRPAGGG